MPQRRRRVYILAYHKSTPIYKELFNEWEQIKGQEWVSDNGLMAKQFPDSMVPVAHRLRPIEGAPHEITKKFRSEESPFGTAGVMIAREAVTADIFPRREKLVTLGERSISRVRSEKIIWTSSSCHASRSHYGKRRRERSQQNARIKEQDLLTIIQRARCHSLILWTAVKNDRYR